MTIAGIILLFLTAAFLIWFLIANKNLIAIRKEFAKLANGKGMAVDQRTVDINKMRSLQLDLKSEGSKILLEKAEGATKNYLSSFRLFLFCMILGVIIVCFIKN